MHLPGPQSVPVASAGIGADQQPRRLGVRSTSQEAPPASDTRDGEFGGLMGNAHVDQRFVPRHIVRAVGNGFSLPQMRKVMHRDPIGRALRLPAAARIGKAADQLLLLRVDADDRIVRPQEPTHLLIDVPKRELGVEKGDVEAVGGGRVAMRLRDPMDQAFEAEAPQVVGHLSVGIRVSTCGRKSRFAKAAREMGKRAERLEQVP